MTVNQDDVMTTLSYLRGENSVPTSNVEGRKNFIQRTLEEVYRAHPWKFAAKMTTLTVDASGIASLPSDLTLDHDVNVTKTVGTDEIPLERINVADRDKVEEGDGVYWIESRGDAFYNLYTYEDITQITIGYQSLPPEINASIGTPYLDRLALALGANRWVKMSEDPQADISQDDILFRNQLQQSIAGESRNMPRRQRRNLQNITGHFTGSD